MLTQQLALNLKTRPEASLENYFPGHNLGALDALERLLQQADTAQLFLGGASGCGKSHLLMSACRSATEQHLACAYLPLADLAKEPPSLLEGLHGYDLLALDDVQAIAGNTAWEHALFVLYNLARDAGCRLLFSANVGPAALPIVLPDLRSRLCWGLSFQLHPLNDEEKCAFLRDNAKKRGLELGVDVANWLISRHARDLPSLLDALDKLDRASLAEQRRLTVPFIRSQLQSQ